MDRINTLFGKYKNNLCTPEEVEELLEYFRIGDKEDLLKSLIDAQLNQEAETNEELGQATREVYAQVKRQILLQKRRTKRLRLRWMAAAASILLFLSIGGYFLIHKQPQQQTAQNGVHDVAPGTNRATLTLAGGQKMRLNEST